MTATRRDPVLVEMIESMKKGPAIYAPSVFWEQLIERHIEELEAEGFENFKRTLNMKYFNWGVLASCW